MITIELPEQHTPCIVVEHKTGVIYSTQAGGNYCAQPSAEGYLILLHYWDESEVARVTRNDWAGVLRETIKSKARLNAIRNSLDEAKDGNIQPLDIVLDVRRIQELEECGEAWLPICCKYGKGFLTWPNSD